MIDFACRCISLFNFIHALSYYYVDSPVTTRQVLLVLKFAALFYPAGVKWKGASARALKECGGVRVVGRNYVGVPAHSSS